MSTSSNDFGRKCVNKCNGGLGDKLQEIHSNLSCRESEIVSEALKINNGMLVGHGYLMGKLMLSLIIALSQCAPEDKILLIMEGKRSIRFFCGEIWRIFGDSLSYEISKDYRHIRSNWVPKSKLIIVEPNVLTEIYDKLNIEESHIYSKQNFRGKSVQYYKKVDNPLHDKNNVQGLHTFYATKWGAMIVDECQDYFSFKHLNSKPVYAICAQHRWLVPNGNNIPEELEYEYKPLFAYYLLLNDKSVPNNLPDFLDYIISDSFTGVKNTMILQQKQKQK